MDLYKRALKRIEQDKQCRPVGCCFGPAGATGPTHPVKSVKYPNFKAITLMA